MRWSSISQVVECESCGEEIEETVNNGEFFECPECGQEYLFDPTEASAEDKALEEMKESLDKQEQETSQEDEEESEEVQQQVIVPSEEDQEESENPECEHCGEEMDEAPEHIESDWLCHNDGCEGSFREEDLEEDEGLGESEENTQSPDEGLNKSTNSEEDKEENQLWPPS